MKRLSFAIMLALCTMGVWAQEGIKVEFEGANPNIFDFAWSYLINYDPNTEDYEATSGIRDALERYLQNENQDDGVTLIVDKKAGFISYEHLHQGHAQLIEMCFWNEADKKHKLFAYSNWSYFNGHPELGQFDALAFYRYDNATKTMEYTLTPGFDVTYENGTTYSLPRVGKDIKVNKWDGGMKNQTTLKWNGHGFDEQPAAKSGQAVGQKWRSMKDFKEGLAPVMNDEEFWGFVDETGKLVIPCRYRQVGSFSEGLAYVSDDYQFYGYIDKTGRLVIPMDFKEAGNFENGKADVTTENNKAAVIDKTGKIIK